MNEDRVAPMLLGSLWLAPSNSRCDSGDAMGKPLSSVGLADGASLSLDGSVVPLEEARSRRPNSS